MWQMSASADFDVPGGTLSVIAEIDGIRLIYRNENSGVSKEFREGEHDGVQNGAQEGVPMGMPEESRGEVEERKSRDTSGKMEELSMKVREERLIAEVEEWCQRADESQKKAEATFKSMNERQKRNNNQRICAEDRSAEARQDSGHAVEEETIRGTEEKEVKGIPQQKLAEEKHFEVDQRELNRLFLQAHQKNKVDEMTEQLKAQLQLDHVEEDNDGLQKYGEKEKQVLGVYKPGYLVETVEKKQMQDLENGKKENVQHESTPAEELQELKPVLQLNAAQEEKRVAERPYEENSEGEEPRPQDLAENTTSHQEDTEEKRVTEPLSIENVVGEQTESQELAKDATLLHKDDIMEPQLQNSVHDLAENVERKEIEPKDLVENSTALQKDDITQPRLEKPAQDTERQTKGAETQELKRRKEIIDKRIRDEDLQRKQAYSLERELALATHRDMQARKTAREEQEAQKMAEQARIAAEKAAEQLNAKIRAEQNKEKKREKNKKRKARKSEEVHKLAEQDQSMNSTSVEKGNFSESLPGDNPLERVKSEMERLRSEMAPTGEQAQVSRNARSDKLNSATDQLARLSIADYYQGPLFEIRPCPDTSKGVGMFARKSIKKGIAIFQEAPMMHTWGYWLGFEASYKNLSEEKKKAFLQMEGRCACATPNCICTEVMKVCCSVNQTNLPGETACTGIYPIGNRMNHSCIPNSMGFFEPGFYLTFRALQDIQKDEEITRYYRNGETRFLTRKTERRARLKRYYGFDCRCEACEQDINMSSMKKPRCFTTTEFEKIFVKFPSGEIIGKLTEEENKKRKEIQIWERVLHAKMNQLANKALQDMDNDSIMNMPDNELEHIKPIILKGFRDDLVQFVKENNRFELSNEILGRTIAWRVGEFQAHLPLSIRVRQTRRHLGMSGTDSKGREPQRTLRGDGEPAMPEVDENRGDTSTPSSGTTAVDGEQGVAGEAEIAQQS